MQLRELGSEQALVERIARPPRNGAVMVGIGDDCAVVRIDAERLHLYTTDMLVEAVHFSLGYFSPFELGVKAMESNVSDIAAMGGRVLHALVALSLPPSTEVHFVDELFRGFYEVCERYGFDLLGGDTVRGEHVTLSISLVGETTPGRLRLRSMAEPGDLIAVSGPLGGSAAGLRLLQEGIDGFAEIKRLHTLPRCAMDRLESILPLAKAMEDVSDGLATEVRNICRASRVGAQLYAARLPLSSGVEEVAALFGEDPREYALYGGEDFQLVYTLAAEHRDRVVGSIVGEILAKRELLLDGTVLVRSGYDALAAPGE